MSVTRHRGFTLVELMVSLVVLGILLAFALPTYQQWIANARVRTTSQSIQQGLRLARNQAVDQARWVRFELVSANSADWAVCVPETSVGFCSGLSTMCSRTAQTGCVLQRYVSRGGDFGVTLASTAGNGGPYSTPIEGINADGVTFDPLGRPLTNNKAPLGRVDVYSTLRGTRRLVDVVSAAGAIRECDANLPLTSDTPEGCS